MEIETLDWLRTAEGGRLLVHAAQAWADHAGDPVLRWCAANLVARKDVNLNMAPDKKRSAEKIDDFSALLMAVGVSMAAEESGDMAGFLANPVVGS